MWLWVVLVGHFANAGAFVIDKILLTKQLKHPTVYVFYVGLLGVVAVVLVPFAHLTALTSHQYLESIGASVAFMAALLCFFEALKRGVASRIVPIVGSLVPVWTLTVASLYLGESLVGWQGYGLVSLVFGAALISYEDEASISVSEFVLSVVAAALFAASFTLAKAVFNDVEFLNAFLWMRLFSFLAVLPLLFLTATRVVIFGKARRSERPRPLFFIGQSLGASGFLLLNWGVELAPAVTLVNALQGVQYAFLFLFILLFNWLAPGILGERFTRKAIFRKSIAIITLGVGLVLITI